MANKEELVEQVEKIPEFMLRDVGIKNDADQFEEKPKDKAVTEVANTRRIAYVTDRYNLVQFKDVFLPILNNIDSEVQGRVMYFHGVAIMEMYPDDEQYKQDGTKFGIVLKNSVDKTSSVVIRFCVAHKGRSITFPQSIAGYKKSHLNRHVGDMATAYGTVIGKIRQEWATIVEKFPEIEVDADMMKSLVNDKKFGFTDGMKRYLKNKLVWAMTDDKKYNLWDFFENCIDFVGKRSYKTEVHKRQQIDGMVAKIMEYGFLSKF